MTRKKFASVATVAAGALVLGAVFGQPGSGRASGNAPIPSGCPSGSGPIKIADLTPPARLMIQRQGITPEPVTGSATSIQVQFMVTACNGRPVQGASVFAVSIPYNEFTQGQSTTGANGTVSLTESRMPGFPASHRQELLVMLVRATKPGESLLGGVSSRRAISFPVSLG